MRSIMPELAVLGSTVNYLDSGTGSSFVFLHGNPSSSYLWRNVLPGVGNGRLLAPDLIGMGASGKPGIGYSFADHARYLDAWFDGLGLDRVILVGHDWGGALAFDWAARHPERVAGVAFLESVIKPREWDDLSPESRARTESALGPAGEQIVLGQDAFIRSAFTTGVLTPVGPRDLDAYLAPYPTPESRRPILAWVRQRPLGGKPAEVVARLDAYAPWLAASEDVPKLLMTFEGPGLIVDKRITDWCAGHITALEIVACGRAGHHAPEDRPEQIARAIAAWADHHQLRDESNALR
jgi:haloalkane dehalogenase